MATYSTPRLVVEQDEVARSQGAPLGPNARADLRLPLL
jgi:hypothetical protein